MNELAPNMTDLKGKIEQLVKLHQQLKKDNDNLAAENEELKTKLTERDNRIGSLEKSNRELVEAKTAEQNTMITDTKVKINELVQEIDDCIALLNK